MIVLDITFVRDVIITWINVQYVEYQNIPL
jgi:hypothetical protein